MTFRRSGGLSTSIPASGRTSGCRRSGPTCRSASDQASAQRDDESDTPPRIGRRGQEGAGSVRCWTSLRACLFLEPVLSVGLHLVEIRRRVEDNSFPLDTPDALVLAGAAGIGDYVCRDAPLRSIRISNSLTCSGHSAENFVAILEHYGQITRNRPVAVDVISGSPDPGFGALQTLAVRRVVREPAMNSKMRT